MSTSLVVMAALVSVVDLFAPFLAPATREGRRGAVAYENRNWPEAADRFARAVTESPDGAGEFNLGAAAYRLGKHEDAAQAFASAAGQPGVPLGDAAYNLGDARFRSGDVNGALAAFRAALRENPDDADARVNYEIALRRLAEGSPPQPQKDQTGKDSGNQGENQANSQQGAASDSSRSSGENQASNPEGENQDQKGTPPPGGKDAQAQLLTPEEARRLLDAVTPEERELLMARLKSRHRKRVEKDW